MSNNPEEVTFNNQPATGGGDEDNNQPVEPEVAGFVKTDSEPSNDNKSSLLEMIKFKKGCWPWAAFKGAVIAVIIITILYIFWYFVIYEKPTPTTADMIPEPIVVANDTPTTAVSRFTAKKKDDYQFGHINKDTLNENQLEGFLSSRSGSDTIYDFNDPSKEPHNQLLKDSSDMGWDPAKMSLDQDTIDSHNEFVQEAYLSGPGAGASVGLQTNTHLTAPNKWWGLRRVDYTSAFSQNDARVVSSEYPDQIKREVGTYTV